MLNSSRVVVLLLALPCLLLLTSRAPSPCSFNSLASIEDFSFCSSLSVLSSSLPVYHKRWKPLIHCRNQHRLIYQALPYIGSEQAVDELQMNVMVRALNSSIAQMKKSIICQNLDLFSIIYKIEYLLGFALEKTKQFTDVTLGCDWHFLQHYSGILDLKKAIVRFVHHGN